ncbi:hypothetical protein CHS0354_016689, partial [Potamilus streckersoni]
MNKISPPNSTQSTQLPSSNIIPKTKQTIIEGPAPKKVKLDFTRRQNVTRAYNLQKKLTQLRNGLLTSQRYRAIPTLIPKITNIGIFPPTTPLLDLIKTGWAIQSIEQAVELGSHDPILNISQLPSFCKLHQDKIDALHARQMNITIPNKPTEPTNHMTSMQPQDQIPPSVERLGNGPTNTTTPQNTPVTTRRNSPANFILAHHPVTAGPSQYPTPHGIATAEEGDSIPITTTTQINASTIYPWITDFEEIRIGPKGKQTINGKSKVKNHNVRNSHLTSITHPWDMPPPSPTPNQLDSQATSCPA